MLIQGVQAAIQAAPQVIALVESGKNMITALFTAKLITAEQQSVLHAHIDSISAMAKAGIVPAHWQVQADPA